MSNLFTQLSKQAYKLIKKIILLSPDKRDGSIMNCFQNSNNNLVTDQREVQYLIQKHLINVSGGLGTGFILPPPIARKGSL
jgi:hypothetical protein